MPDLPSGTVTFLFTDIEGSTSLWEQHPDTMRAALERHDRMLHRAVKSSSGHIVKTTGDGVVAVFTTAKGALAACLSAQRTLQAANAGTSRGQAAASDTQLPTALKVRMGLHSGVAELRGGDYFGTTMNRAARIMSAAHGEQVLLSAATAELLRGSLPEGVTLRDVGEHRLKGLRNSEPLLQIVASGLRAEFPWLASQTGHDVPVPLASFVGREQDLEELRRLLARSRLVTLTGIGGIGKTRLSLQVAAEAADDYPDGVWFVELAPISDSRLVANAVASTLGVKEEAGRPVIEALFRFLKDRAILLVLDNCEHVLQACAELATDLLRATRRMTILATSREPLHVSGEAAFPVATLPTPDRARALPLDALSAYAAVRLFLDRAIDARPDFALTSANATAVARICCDLDGIPLALELAAARVRAMSAEAIAGHLTDRFALLKGGDRTALPRQQTLRAMIDWSYDLLAPQERTLLQRLAVFAGGFALDAAAAVGAGDEVASGEVLDLLCHLVDKSLVAFDAQNERYRLLETVRQYALERLAESGEEARTRDRHLGFCVALSQRAVSGLVGPKQTLWRTRLDAERENILLAFAHARRATGGGPAGLTMIHGFSLWFGWGHLELWHRVILEALAHPEGQQENAARSHALYTAAQVSYLTGRHDDGFALAQASVGIARACGDAHALIEALYRLGVVAMAVDRWSEAREHFVEGLALSRQAGDLTLVAALSGGLAELYSTQGQLELAEPLYLEALARNRGDRDPESTSTVLVNLARNAIALRSVAKAVQYLREVVAVASPGYSIGIAMCLLLNCAGLAALCREWMLALRMSGAADSHRERNGLLGDSVEVRFHARDMAPVRDALGAAAADAAFAAGRALSSDTAILEAETWLATLAVDGRAP